VQFSRHFDNFFSHSEDEQDISSSAFAADSVGSYCSGGDSSSELGSSGIVQKGPEDKEWSVDVRVGSGKRDYVVVFTARLFSQVCT